MTRAAPLFSIPHAAESTLEAAAAAAPPVESVVEPTGRICSTGASWSRFWRGFCCLRSARLWSRRRRRRRWRRNSPSGRKGAGEVLPRFARGEPPRWRTIHLRGGRRKRDELERDKKTGGNSEFDGDIERSARAE